MTDYDGNVSGILPPKSQLYEVGSAKGEYIMYTLPRNRYVGMFTDQKCDLAIFHLVDDCT